MNLDPRTKAEDAFTLVELLVVMTVIAVLASLLLPVIGNAKTKAKVTTCINNLRQVNLAIRMYAEDHNDALPALPDPNPYANGIGAFYKELVKGYVSLTRLSSAQDRVFACPADRVRFKDPTHDFTSFTFNGFETGYNDIPRITGKPLDTVAKPSKAVLVGEYPAFWGNSWHAPRPQVHNNARNAVSFVDGHASYLKIYWNGVQPPLRYEPTPGYEYSWSGD